MTRKILKKDLPFEINAGAVITREDFEYSINGDTPFRNTKESDLISAIWDNPEWFDNSEISQIEMIIHNNKIELDCESLRLDQVQDFGKGIMNIMNEYFKWYKIFVKKQEESYKIFVKNT